MTAGQTATDTAKTAGTAAARHLRRQAVRRGAQTAATTTTGSAAAPIAAAILVVVMALAVVVFVVFSAVAARGYDNTATAGCGAGGATPAAATPQVAAAALVVGRQASPKVLLASFEAGLVESGMRNLANDGKRGPEDKAATDEALAIAAQSLALPHDGVGTDNDSVGVLQQRNHWGSPAERLDPTYAFAQFYQRAIPLDQAGFAGTAGQLAQTVQGSAFPERYDQREADATALLNRIAGGSGVVACAPISLPGGFTEPTSDSYQRLTPATKHVYGLVVTTFGVTDIGGWRAVGSVAGSDHPHGRAIDVMIHGNIALGQQIAGWAVANAAALQVKYVIHAARIWTPAKGWHPYRHPSDPCNCNPTLRHDDHVHISVLA